jgi:phospholipase C
MGLRQLHGHDVAAHGLRSVAAGAVLRAGHERLRSLPCITGSVGTHDLQSADGGGVSWRVYYSLPGEGGYQYSGCTYFAECLYGPQSANIRQTMQVIQDAQGGTLPSVSVVFPTGVVSQHNQSSMRQGDNYIGDIVDAVANGPDWSTSAVFITWDDCGCFYDHVAPPNGLGLREPMVIVSPYAKPGYTDHSIASFASWLAFVEHNWQLGPLTPLDANAYDYADSFDFSQSPLLKIPRMVDVPIPEWEQRYLEQHPPDPDDIT